MRDFHEPGRSCALAARAMCATSHQSATLAGLDCLRDKGSAVDAAIAAAAVLAVVEPHMTGIGGDCFALIAEPDGTLHGLNGSGPAPMAMDPDWFARKGLDAVPERSADAVTIPGAIRSWGALHARFGRLEWPRLFEAAIELAEQGFAVAPRVASDWAGQVEKIASNPASSQMLFKAGRAPRAGEIMRFGALAETLRAIAAEGADAFYEGPIARDIVDELRRLDGAHAMDDFANFAPEWVAPLLSPYGAVELVELPPNGHGITAQIMLNILSRLDISVESAGDGLRYHVLLEAARLAYHVRDSFVADPRHGDVPVSHMLSDGLARDLAGKVDMTRRRADLGPVPQPPDSDTVYLAAVDENGLAVSFINSLFASFGSGLTVPERGIILHSRGCGFRATPGHPNSFAPGNRPLHTIIPAMTMQNGRVRHVFGVMGGHYQPMGHVSVLTNMLDFAMDPQEALDWPRAFFEDGRVGVEKGVPQAARRQLAQLGHDVIERAEPFGGGQIIEIDHAGGVLRAGSDFRKDGMAAGW